MKKEQIQTTEIRTAEVIDRTDIDAVGIFYARISMLGEGAQPINYVSPYGSAAQAGLIAVPETGTQVLVCKPSGSSEWFYIGSTFTPEPIVPIDADTPDPTPGPPGLARVAPGICKKSGVPSKIVLKGNNGQGLEISDEQDGKTTNNIKTELISANKKKITLNDSPGIDSIKLDSGNNASITLTQNPDRPDQNAGAIFIDSIGPQLHVSKESDLELMVLEGGREINVINKANGVDWGGVAGVPDAKLPTAGNVNIQSDRGDVNIFSNSPYTGRIFIETLNRFGQRQLIKIGAAGPDGRIVLQAQSIVLDATGVEGTIDMNAPAGVFINSETAVTTSAPLVNTRAEVEVNIDPGEGVIKMADPGAPPLPSLSPNYALNTNPGDLTNLDDYAGLGVI